MVTVTLQVADEVVALVETAKKEIADIKAQKGIAVYLGDLMPAILALANNYQNLLSDLKQPDDIAYIASVLGAFLLPAPAAAVAAPAAP
jgi:uncharacterized membrane protein